MKREVLLSSLNSRTREFIIRYRLKKQRPASPVICLCEIQEFLFLTPAVHKENILYGTYNNTLELKELQIGFDGDELIDISLYYLEQFIKDRLKRITVL